MTKVYSKFEGSEFVETFRVRAGSVEVWLFGDSHLRDQHKFPGLFNRSRELGYVDERFGPARRMVDWEDPKKDYFRGFTFEPGYLDQLTGFVEERRGKATAMMVSLGTNDIRASDTQETVVKLYDSYKALIRKVEETPGVVLYVLGLIPCDRGVEATRNSLDAQLATHCYKRCTPSGGKIVYLDAAGVLGEVDGKHHRSEFWADDLHLKPEGMVKLVDEFCRLLSQTRSEPFLVDPEVRVPKGHDSRRWSAYKTGVDSRKRCHVGGETPASASSSREGLESGQGTSKSIVRTRDGFRTAHGPGAKTAKGRSSIVMTSEGLKTAHGPGHGAAKGRAGFAREGGDRREEVEESRAPGPKKYTRAEEEFAWDKYFRQRTELEKKFALEREALKTELLPFRLGSRPTEGCKDFREKRRRRDNDRDDHHGSGRSWATGANTVRVFSGRGGGSNGFRR